MTLGSRIAHRFALAAQASCVAAVAFYAVCRMVQAAVSGAPGLKAPARIVAGAHAAYFWRAWTVSYAAVMVGFAVFAASRSQEAKLARGLLVALSIGVALIVLQAVFVP